MFKFLIPICEHWYIYLSNQFLWPFLFKSLFKKMLKNAYTRYFVAVFKFFLGTLPTLKSYLCSSFKFLFVSIDFFIWLIKFHEFPFWVVICKNCGKKKKKKRAARILIFISKYAFIILLKFSLYSTFSPS